MNAALFRTLAAVLIGCSLSAAQTPIAIGNRLEMFCDSFLIQNLDGASLKLHEPVQAGVALRFDKPWEGAFSAYPTVIQDGTVFRLYYRGTPSVKSEEVTCYAESKDGINWSKPLLGLFEVMGTRSNNVVLAGMKPFSANFAPFLDSRPGTPPPERFKALAGTDATGLVGFVSEDGIRWRKLREESLMQKGVFDSQNVAFWSESENCYVCYFRTWTEGDYKGIRTVSRATSTNFVHWSDPRPMSFGNTTLEHLYTSQTQPYFRAPHIYIATPMRFMPTRSPLSAEQARLLGIIKGYSSDCADTVLLSSRGGDQYLRPFMEAFIRPGLDPGNWASRSSITACGIVPTSGSEISIYKQAHYAQPSAHLLRYALRTDGFASVNASYAGGQMITKPLTFSGTNLLINFSTSAAGSIRVEIQDESGAALPGLALADCKEHLGDDIERVVEWNSPSASPGLAAGKPVRLRFALKDADLFSFRFR